jgi:uncharacterized lipoprotein YmbA
MIGARRPINLDRSCARRWLGAVGIAMCAALLAASCASPSLRLYTLDTQPASVPHSPSSQPSVVIEIRRVSIPDYLDSEDILVRRDNVLDRSSRGRWATRLSLGVTRFLTARLAQRRPDALVTDQLQAATPAQRIDIAISELDVTVAGNGTLDANWQVTPRDPKHPSLRGRGRFSATGPVATDQQVVTLMTRLLQQLADAIELPR